MIFRHFLLTVNEANAFIIGCEKTREIILIDAGDLDARMVDFIEEKKLRLTAIFITHDHYDHAGGIKAALKRYDVPVLSGNGMAGGVIGRKVIHAERIKVGPLEGTVLATPGHTPDSLSLAFPGLVFTGDALFSGSIGGISSPTDAMREIDHIRKHIFTLPDEYEVHPGHGPSSTVAVERKYNPFFV